MIKVKIFDGQGKDISDDIELVNVRSNPFRWSGADIQYEGKIIGFHESGGFHINDPYTYTEEEIG